MDQLSALDRIAAEALRDELVFPTSAQATQRLQRMLAAPDCHIDTAVQLVQAEPLLAARLIALANSPAYRGRGGEVTQVRAALGRTGFRTLGALASALIVRQLASAIQAPQLRHKAQQLWVHSAQVAALSHILARRVSGIDPETAFFAGIVHEVGGFYLLARSELLPGNLDDHLDAWLDHGEAAIGRTVLQRLQVPQAVMQALEALWVGLRALPPETLGDTLLLANDLAPQPSPLFTQPGHAAGAATIDCVLGEGTLQQVVIDAQDEFAALCAALI